MQGDKSITQWFGENLAILLSEKILAVWSTFKAKSYIEAVKDKCTSLSYTKRIELHADELKKELPDSYEQALEILLGILGEENPNETGMFKEYYWIMPIGKFVEKNGLDHVNLSFKAIEEITKRNTGEYAIRPFIRKYPEETIERMREWAKSTNFHLRRLSAEGLRPKLPWASKLDIFIDNPTPVFNILTLMKKEHIRFVQKSIANNLADYLKINSVPALRLLQNWSKSKNKYTQWMVKYAMRNQKKIITTIITTVLMFCFLPVSKPVLARSVSIPSVQIVATIKPDGTACIEERRTIRFDGSFTEGFYELPKNGYAFLSDFSLSDEEGAYVENFSLNKKQQTYHRTESKDMIRFDFYYQAKDIQKTFTFRYQLHQIVQLYDDFGQFYWQLQGDGWDLLIDQFDAEVRWESAVPIEDYRIWAYGPLWGEVLRASDHHSTVKVTHLPRNNFVEVRLLLPSSYFTMSQTHPGSLLEQLLEQELKNAEEANQQRDEAKKILASQEKTRNLRSSMGQSVMNAMNVLALLLLLLYFFLYFSYGKERIAKNQHIYYREPPSELKPALAGLLCNMNRWEDKFLQATMLDLIRRKRIKYEIISNEKFHQDKKLTQVDNDKDSLADYEFILLHRMIFDVKKSITLKDLNKQFRESHDHFKKIFQELKNSINKEMKNLGYFDKSSDNQSLFALVLGVILTLAGPIVFSILSVFFMGQASLGFFVLWPVGLLYWMGSKALQRRSVTGIEEFSKWRAFRLFMKDFSNLKAYAPQSLIIWERYLVYATAFGIASVVLKALRVVIPNLMDKNKGTFLAPSLFAQDAIPNMRDLQGAMHGISSISNSVQRVAGSSYSSGTGSGGGFSTGGGGGGGGSGGGFR